VTNEEPAHQRDRIALANAMRLPGSVVWPARSGSIHSSSPDVVFGRLRAQQTPISFEESTPILLRDVHQAIESLCGAPGWAALTKRGED
jgi:hypothetical protein